MQLGEVGGPSGLSVRDVPEPNPGPGEVLVRVRAAALNHRDVFITQGKYPGIVLPATLGSDGAGEVDGRGEVVINPMLGWGGDSRVWSPGASILGMPRAGTFSQYVCVPAENVHPKPAALSMREAAAIPLAGLTAYRATFTRGALRAGETVLLTGIGGGVQTFALLFAKHAGARAIVTSGSDEKLARARELGADVTINYRTDETWAKAARAAGPIDLVIDAAGGDTLAKAIGAVRPGGRIVIYGATLGDATIRPFSIFWNHVDIRGTSMGSPDDFHAMLALFEDGNLRPAIDRTYALDDVPSAMRRMEAANQFGKIIIDIP
jgi:NADPH:quinone reductase-like Zn-dependent oxidoreductase